MAEILLPILEMRYSGGLFKHLGTKMYSGAVPALTELIANAWDADAHVVRVEIPLGIPWAEDSFIMVTDNGQGMSLEECQSKYLVVGRDRRTADHADRTPAGRPIMGHKGLGKLACLGVAYRITVHTVKEGELTDFYFDYDEIMAHSGGDLVARDPYKPPVRRYETGSKEPNGTTVTLSKIRLRRTLGENEFRFSMARRFAVFGEDFQVLVNNDPLRRLEVPTEFRFPDSGLQGEEVEGFGPIRWWVGFTETPIEIDQGRGVSVIVRGKLAQAPFFFEQVKGTTGQHGLQYVIGEVHADGLDQAEDLVATDRASVNWEDDRSRPVLEWGQKWLRGKLREWAALRAEKRIRQVKESTQFSERISRLMPREQKEVEQAIDRLAQVETITPERLEQVVGFILNAYEHHAFIQLIHEINTMDEESIPQLVAALGEWTVLEAIWTAELVRGRVEVIHKFQELVEAGEREVPDLHAHMANHPWLIYPYGSMLAHEEYLDKLLHEKFGADAESSGGRLDFFCLKDPGLYLVVEIKRPGDSVPREKIRRLQDYVNFLEMHLSQEGIRAEVRGVMVLSGWTDDATELVADLRKTGKYEIDTWGNLLEKTEHLNREILAVVKRRAPQEDARIKALGDIGMESPSSDEPVRSGTAAQEPVPLDLLDIPRRPRKRGRRRR